MDRNSDRMAYVGYMFRGVTVLEYTICTLEEKGLTRPREKSRLRAWTIEVGGEGEGAGAGEGGHGPLSAYRPCGRGGPFAVDFVEY